MNGWEFRKLMLLLFMMMKMKMTFLAVVNDIDGGAAADNGDFLDICWFVY